MFVPVSVSVREPDCPLNPIAPVPVRLSVLATLPLLLLSEPFPSPTLKSRSVVVGAFAESCSVPPLSTRSAAEPATEPLPSAPAVLMLPSGALICSVPAVIAVTPEYVFVPPSESVPPASPVRFSATAPMPLSAMTELIVTVSAVAVFTMISPAAFAAPPAVSVPLFAVVPIVTVPVAAAVGELMMPPRLPSRRMPAAVSTVTAVAVFWKRLLMSVVPAPIKVLPAPETVWMRTFDAAAFASVAPFVAMSV